jgi:hypothetical protein
MGDWSDLDLYDVNAFKAMGYGLAGFSVVWPSILWVADLFWRAQESGSDERRAETWHHLVMAAGNFKRQGGTQICLLRRVSDDDAWPDAGNRPCSCTVQALAGEVELRRDSAETWKQLTDKTVVKGIGAATATTILSALWPGDHLVIDKRDLKATVALSFDEVAAQKWIDPRSRKDITVSWGWYDWLRGKVLAKTAELASLDPTISVVDVERSLYHLDSLVRRPKRGGQALSWEEYARALSNALDEWHPRS